MIFIDGNNLNKMLDQILKDQSKLFDIINSANSFDDNKSKLKKGSKKEILEEYKQYMRLDGKAETTIKSYFWEARRMINWLNKNDIVFSGQLERMYIINYMQHLMDSKYSFLSINLIISSLFVFNEFLIEKTYQSDLVVYTNKDLIKVSKGSEGRVEVFSEAEMREIVTYVNHNSYFKVRDNLLIVTLIYTGMRASEIINIKISDIDFESKYLTIKRGKGGVVRDIPLRSEVIDLIKLYIQGERKVHKFSESDYLFLSERANKINRNVLNYVLDKLSLKLSIDIFPHKFRHTFATNLVSKGVNITVVSALLGHSNITTTVAYYLNITRQEKQEAIDLL